MNALLEILFGLIGLVLLISGAEFLVRGGVRLARRFKIPRIVIGLTLVAFATSAPEFVVSVHSALQGYGDLSLGNVIGSNICNIGLILGIAALIQPLRVSRQLLRLDLPVLFLATALLTGFCLIWGGVYRWQALILLGLFFFHTWKNIQNARANAAAHPDSGADASDNALKSTLFRDLLLVIGGTLALVFGARLFVGTAIFLAQLLHVSDAVIGLTIVAVGTSLPELATSAVAAFRGEKEIAVGNVIGSNLFNVMAILGITPLIQPIQMSGILPMDFIAMGVLTLLMYLFMKTGTIIRRWEGAVLLLFYLFYLVLLILRTPVQV